MIRDDPVPGLIRSGSSTAVIVIGNSDSILDRRRATKDSRRAADGGGPEPGEEASHRTKSAL